MTEPGERPRFDLRGARGVLIGDHSRQRNIFRLDLPRGVRVLLLVVLVSALVAGAGVVVVNWVIPMFAPTYKTQFLIDAAVGEDGAGDLASVSDALAAVVGNSGEQDSLALRSFGGECGTDGNTTQLVDFGTGNRQDITEAASSVRRDGRATLQRGIVEAVEDFSAPLSLDATRVNRIIVVTRHANDACDPDAEFVRAQIRDRVASAGLSIEFRFIGYRIPAENHPPLTELTSELNAPRPTFASSPEDLQAALHWFATVEPVLRSSQSVVDVLNPTVDRLNAATESIKDGRFDLAQAALDEAEAAVVDVEIEDLADRGRSPEGVRPRELAIRLRALQEKVLLAAEELLTAARSGEDLRSVLATYKGAADEYNREARNMTDELARLRAQGPGGSS
jgi:hypothetical protein